METPLPGLKLIITKGPKSGEILEFKPGSVIRIGRTKRGNTFNINEDGISSKHLVIESKSGKWTVQDLNSSNGTILNSKDLPPDTSVDLHEDDAVKIGEETAILVKFMAAGKEQPPPRRNPRRQVKATVTRGQTEEELAENLEIKCQEAVEDEGKVTRKGRVRRKNLQEMPPESDQVQVEVAGGRDVGKIKCEEVKEKASQLTRRGRGRRRNLQEMPLESGQMQVDGNENLKIEGEVCGGDVEGRNLEMECEEVKEKASRVTRKGRGRRGNLPEMPPVSSPVQVENNGNLRSEEVAGGRDVAESSDKVEDNGENGVNRGVKESGNQVKERVESSVEDKGPDLEKMTLGEWFDYMEVYLPKQIIKETEEMIEGMRRKAASLHDYMIEKKKEKSKQ